MKPNRITPVRLLIVAGVIGAIAHFWPSSNQTTSPSESPAVAVHEKTKHKTPAEVVAKLEGHASFDQTIPTKLAQQPEIKTHPITTP